TGDLRVLFSGNATDGKRITRVLRTFPLPDEFHQGEWRLRWHHGLLDVRRAGKRVAVGHIEQAAQPLLPLRWLQTTGSARCRTMRLEGTAPARLTAEQARELEQAGRHNDEAVRLTGERKFREALEPARRALETRTKQLGEKHPHTALSLANLA